MLPVFNRHATDRWEDVMSSDTTEHDRGECPSQFPPVGFSVSAGVPRQTSQIRSGRTLLYVRPVCRLRLGKAASIAVAQRERHGGVWSHVLRCGLSIDETEAIKRSSAKVAGHSRCNKAANSRGNP